MANPITIDYAVALCSPIEPTLTIHGVTGVDGLLLVAMDGSTWTFPRDVDVEFDAGGRTATVTIPAGTYAPAVVAGKVILRRRP